MKQSEPINELAEALAKAQGQIENVTRDKQANVVLKSGKTMSYKYADLASVLETCKKPLAENDLSVVQTPFTHEDGSISLSQLLLHKSGQWIQTDGFRLRPRLNRDETYPGPQAIGSAISYARRYALSALLGLSQEDDDAQKASGHFDRNTGRKALDQAAAKQKQEIDPTKLDPKDPKYRKSLDKINNAQAKRFHALNTWDELTTKAYFKKRGWESTLDMPWKEYEGACTLVQSPPPDSEEDVPVDFDNAESWPDAHQVK